MQQPPVILKRKKRTPASLPSAGGNPLPKEKITHEEPKKETDIKPEASVRKPRKEAEKPAVPSRQPAEARRPRPAPERAPAADEALPEREGQLSLHRMLELSFTAKHDLWRELNKGTAEHEFVTLLRPELLPKAMKNDTPPAKSPNKEAMWCCYCGEWMKFRVFSYTGYEQCIGCGMSSKDFYNARANKLFNQ